MFIVSSSSFFRSAAVILHHLVLDVARYIFDKDEYNLPDSSTKLEWKSDDRFGFEHPTLY